MYLISSGHVDYYSKEVKPFRFLQKKYLDKHGAMIYWGFQVEGTCPFIAPANYSSYRNISHLQTNSIAGKNSVDLLKIGARMMGIAHLRGRFMAAAFLSWFAIRSDS